MNTKVKSDLTEEEIKAEHAKMVARIIEQLPKAKAFLVVAVNDDGTMLECLAGRSEDVTELVFGAAHMIRQIGPMFTDDEEDGAGDSTVH